MKKKFLSAGLVAFAWAVPSLLQAFPRLPQIVFDPRNHVENHANRIILDQTKNLTGKVFETLDDYNSYFQNLQNELQVFNNRINDVLGNLNGDLDAELSRIGRSGSNEDGKLTFSDYVDPNDAFSTRINQFIDAKDVESMFLSSTAGLDGQTPLKFYDYQQGQYLAGMNKLEEAQKKSKIDYALRLREIAKYERAQFKRLEQLIAQDPDKDPMLAFESSKLWASSLNHLRQAEDIIIDAQRPTATEALAQDFLAEDQLASNLMNFDITKGVFRQ